MLYRQLFLGAWLMPFTRSVRAAAPIAVALAFLLAVAPASAPSASAAPRLSLNDSQEHRPYDNKLFRLVEILGAIHYLRELCKANEGQIWRQQMTGLIDAEGTTAKRRSRMVKTFNRGYRGYQRTYRSCTRPATLAITRFMKEGETISKAIVRASK